MVYWRHVVLTGLRNPRMLRLSAISHLQCGPTMQDITQRVNGCRKFSSLAGRYAENVLRYVKPWVVHRARGSLAGYSCCQSLLVPEREGASVPSNCLHGLWCYVVRLVCLATYPCSIGFERRLRMLPGDTVGCITKRIFSSRHEGGRALGRWWAEDVGTLGISISISIRR
ncbi:hypothetical protein N431DRAFT_167958 [Stipitochalara longipes BDJ]|nr:hypothetical protein N431DRAFT_167958 [Stipitochalara longipes BDJ]